VEILPNGIPNHIMTSGFQDGDDLIFLLWCERLSHMVNGIQQIVLDLLEARHGGLEMESAELIR
jgi:hypothetical protein